MLYSDGATIKVGDVVTERGLERFFVIGFEGGNSVKMILIGTVQKEGSPSFGETLIIRFPKATCEAFLPGL